MYSFRSKLIFPAILIILVLTAAAGCGHVARNYPVQSKPKSALPEEFKTPQGRETSLVWEDPGRVQGFLSLWRDTRERAETFKRLAANSNLEAHKEGARMYADLFEKGIAEATLWVFFAKDAEYRCSTGDFEIQFEDGTTVRDQGVLYVETRDVEKPYRYTREGGLILSSEPVGKGEPLRVLLFLPAENLGKQITQVSYMRES